MHSSFTYNPNAHRASNYQQQSGQQPMYNIGAPYTGFMNHHNNMNHTFTRSFASVVSCETDAGKVQNINNNGILNTFMKHLLPQSHNTKEFEDFTRMPSLPAHNYINNHPPPHFYHQPPSHHIKIPIIGGQFYPQTIPNTPQAQPSANDNKNISMTRNLMDSFFQRPKPRQQKWFGRGWRCGKQWNKNQKFRDHSVNLQKNVHEKERTTIEREIQDDICDFVHVDKDVMVNDVKTSSNNPNETAKGSCDDPPFMIYSLEEFPAIVPAETSASPEKPEKSENSEEGFVVLPENASASTPCYAPRRFTLCETVGQIIKSSPTRINGYLKPCLKPSRRRVSECSDIEIEFLRTPEDELQDLSFSGDESETDSDDDEDDVDGIEEVAENETSDEEEVSEDEEEELPEHQLDSGVEEKSVRFNLTPQVHVMRVWDCAYRLSRKGQIWQQYGRDSERFRNRVDKLQSTLNPVLSADHRQRIYRERFQDAD